MRTIFKDGIFDGKTALITGGGTGIGLRTARELASLGATVVLASRTLETLKKAVAKIEGEGGKAVAVELNVRVEESVKKGVDDAINKTGNIDFLVNNAGGQFPSKAEDIRIKGWNAVLELNVTGNFLMSRELFIRCFKDNGGAIVNVTANVWNGSPLMSHTGAARAGIENLTKTLAIEWARHGVRVNAVAPGMIDSSGLNTYEPEMQKSLRDRAQFNVAKRLGTEAEVAAAIAFLLSPAAAFITGDTIKIDGGESIYSPWYPTPQHESLPPYDD